jgi:hypothetical protein
MVPVVIFPARQAFRLKFSAYTSVTFTGVSKITDMADDILLKWVFDQ